jgi:hypothetical protein
MNEGPINIIEDYLDGIFWIELNGSLIGGKGKLISYFHMAPPAIWLILPDSWG